MSVRSAAVVVLWIAFGLRAHAQVDRTDAQSAPADAAAEAEAPPPPPTFKPPAVSDPMLEAPAAPGRELRSWDEALAMIRAHSPDYLSNYQSVLRAQAQTRTALAAVLPVLNGQLSHIHQFVTAKQTIGDNTIESPPRDVVGAGLNLNWPIINPRGLYGIGTAKRNAKAAQLAFEDERRQIAITVVDAMLSTLAAARVSDLNRVGLRTALERAALTTTRLQYGQGTQLDVERAQQDVAAARSQVISGDEALRQASEALGVALGSEVPFTTSHGLDLEAFEQAVARTCRLNADIERRPDVEAARMRVEVAERAISDAELMFVPTINVLSQLNRASAVTLGPLTTFSLQGVLSVPLYDGGLRYAALRDTRAAAEQARQALVQTRVNAIVSAARAERAVAVLQASRDVAVQQRDLARSIDARTREGYARGFGTSLDLVLSAQALRQAETNLVLLEFQVGQARAGAVLANAECVF
jgi:outer membrane protein TolC